MQITSNSVRLFTGSDANNLRWRKRRTFHKISIAIVLVVQLYSICAQAQENEHSNGAAAFWLSNDQIDDRPTNASESKTEAQLKLGNVLNRVGPNVWTAYDFHDFTDIKLEESIEAWRLLHERAQQFAKDQVHFYRPKLRGILRAANTSSACRQSMELVLDSMLKLESWPVKMWSSTGSFPPVGLVDGQIHDVGAYRSCVDMPLATSRRNKAATTTTTTSNISEQIGYTSYCSLPFRPIIPSKPYSHHLFEQVPAELRDTFKPSDIFTDLLEEAQYFYYYYMKTGVCVPHQCSAQDLQQVAIVLGRRFGLMSGPVKCFTRAPPPQSSATSNEQQLLVGFGGAIENQPISIHIDMPMNLKQKWAAILLSSFFGVVFLATIWHAIDRRLTKTLSLNAAADDDYDSTNKQGTIAGGGNVKEKKETVNGEYGGLKHVAFNYFSLITNTSEFLDTTLRSDEIKCVHGLKVITMIWIIMVHTLQYNDLSETTRIYDIVPTLQNPVLHPIYNANYVVDNFFFMSGLLAAYTSWKSNCKQRAGSKTNSGNFNIVSNLVGRYLRLTPQMFMVSLLYILLPLAGDSPYWFDVTHFVSKSCERNWWINVLQLQSFYKNEEICNLVSWWVSVDMFFYVIAACLLYMMMLNQRRRKQALVITSGYVILCLLVTTYRHYEGNMTPNNLGTVLQVAENWSQYVLFFYWSPFPHAFPFFTGFWLGYALANNKWRQQVKQWSRLGWWAATLSMVVIIMSSHVWMGGWVKFADHGQWVSTAYFNVCLIVWICSFGWVIAACHYGCAPKTINQLFSGSFFVLMSKASYIIYLSHLIVCRLYIGRHNTLLEISVKTIMYAFIGNTLISAIFGMFLCVSFEGPSMKFQKFIVQKLKTRSSNCNDKELNDVKTSADNN